MTQIKAITLAASMMLAGTSFALAATPYELTILHINDHHSHLDADSGLDLMLAGEKTRVTSGGFPAMVTKFNDLAQAHPNVLKLHAGDAITGDLYYTLFKGEADAALMNQICFDAFALGNHEFDDGDAGLKRFLDFLQAGTCKTPVLAANVKPELGVSPLTQDSATDYIQPHVVLERGGKRIGVIGIDIATKTKQSSSPDASTVFLNEIATAQRQINLLDSQGVDHIVLLTHQQYANDLTMAQSLTGADGNTVCVAQAWEYSQIVGKLSVTFNDAGEVVSCAGTPHMMLADSFKRKNAEGKRVQIEGDARTAAIAAVANHPSLSIVTENAEAADLLASYNAQVDGLKQTVIGTVASPLCLERIPGQGKSKMCAPEATQKHGSDISNLVAQAFRDMSRTGDIAIQNGGGVRTDVPAGEFSVGAAYQLLPFANTLVEMHMTGAEIHQVLEEALDYALSPDGSTGAYPYAAGLRWNIDASQPMGQRFSNIQFKGPNDGDWSALNNSKTYKVITNNYIAGGRDGYLTFKTVAKDNRMVDTYLDYAQSFVDYVTTRGTIDKLPLADYSIQSYSQ